MTFPRAELVASVPALVEVGVDLFPETILFSLATCDLGHVLLHNLACLGRATYRFGPGILMGGTAREQEHAKRKKQGKSRTHEGLLWNAPPVYPL
jgi:hypothetical protein